MRAAIVLAGLLLVSPLACKQTDHEIEQTAKAVTTAVPRVGVDAELQMVRGLVNTHHALHQSWPERLDATDGMPRLKYASEYVYDSSTGEVKSRTFPDL